MNDPTLIKPALRTGLVNEYYFSAKLAEIARMRQEGADIINLGIGSPDMAPAALTALKLMSFDGKDRLEKSINEMYQQQMEMQQATTQAQQAVGQQEELLVMMNDYIKQLTGEDMLDGSTVGQPKQAQMLPEGQVM